MLIVFPDKLSILGGTLGLFTGMSLLSVVEAVFWTLNAFSKVGFKKKT